jgi:hypothetical protein
VKSILSRRPSPALVISCVALFLSLGGVSYGVATGFIDSRELKDNTIRSRDVRNNTLRTFDIRNNEVRGFDIRNSSIQGRDVAFDTLTGADISEQSLGKVPSAGTADTASSVSGLVTIAPTTVAQGAAPATLATHGPLTLTGACEADGLATEAKLRVQTTEANSAAGGTSAADAEAPRYSETLVPGVNGAVIVVELSDAPGGTRRIGEATVFASAPSSKSFTGTLGMHADATAAGSCLFHGQVSLQG